MANHVQPWLSSQIFSLISPFQKKAIHEPDLIQASLQEIQAVAGEEVLIEAGVLGIRGIGGAKVEHVALLMSGDKERLSVLGVSGIKNTIMSG